MWVLGQTQLLVVENLPSQNIEKCSDSEPCFQKPGAWRVRYASTGLEALFNSQLPGACICPESDSPYNILGVAGFPT